MQRLIMLALFLTLGSAYAFAQNSQFKALFLYNFAQNIFYPEGSVNGKFTITVIGDSEVASELKELAKSRKVGSNTLIIKETNSLDNNEDSQIIYLADSQSNQMPMLQSKLKDKPVLLVGNKQGLHVQGAGICFVMVDGKLRFEICPKNIEEHGIKCSSKLTSLGIAVN